FCEEEELEIPTLSYEHFKGSHWVEQVAKRLVDHTDLLLVGHFNKHEIQTMLTELAQQDCDLLLLSERSWPSHANMLCAIDPLHRGDEKSIVDKAIVSRGSKLEQTLSGKMTLVYCRYVAPYLSRYRAEILSNQKAGITDFITAQKLTRVPLLLPEGNPETALPKAVKQSQAAIL
ncbi:universal stress protein, partial [Vibrio parahaemolyticus]|nr:universal stress protein [Vibrio parahaemolyticus]